MSEEGTGRGGGDSVGFVVESFVDVGAGASELGGGLGISAERAGWRLVKDV